jgi:signal transduction histidine kinase
MWLVSKERLTLGAALFLVYTITAVSINSLILEGLLPVLAPTLILFSVIGGMMLKRWEGYLLGVVSALAYVVVRLLALDNAFPLQLRFSTVLYMELFLTTLAFIFVVYFNNLGTQDLRRSLEEATYDLRRLNLEVQEASDRKSQFTARTSHELRTPLSAIIVFSDLTLREAYGPLSEEMRNAQQHIATSARHLKRIINDLLDLSKIEAGEFEICDEPFDLEQIADVIEGTCQPVATSKEIGWSINIDEDMPLFLRGDAERITQIAINLTGNALKFTDEGQVSMRIEPVDDEHWRMLVSDTGPGIPEDQQELVFEAFRSLDKRGTSSVAESTGLGLAIARNLAQMMGGDIKLESTLGVGSVFEVQLPLVQSEGEEQPRNAEA